MKISKRLLSVLIIIASIVSLTGCNNQTQEQIQPKVEKKESAQTNKDVEEKIKNGKYEIKDVNEVFGYDKESQDLFALKNIDVNGRTFESIMLNFFTDNVSWTDNGNGTITFKGTSHFDDNDLPMNITYTIHDGKVIQGDWYMDGQSDIMEPEVVGYTIDIMCHIAGVEFNNNAYALLSGMGENTSDYEKQIVAGLLGQGEFPESQVKENVKTNQYSTNNEKLLFATMITAGLKPSTKEQMVNMFAGSGPKYTLALTTEQLLKICNAAVGVVDTDENGFYIGVETDAHAWLFYCDMTNSNVYMLRCVDTNSGKNVPLKDSVSYLQNYWG